MRSPIRNRLLLALALASLLAGLATAAAGPKGKKTRKGPAVTKVSGELTKVTNKKGRLVGARLKDAGGKVYFVVLDRKGTKLAKALAGKQVEVTGRLRVRGKGKARRTWLRVQAYKETAPPKAASAEAVEDELEDPDVGDDDG
jgi:hypothetical protein